MDNQSSLNELALFAGAGGGILGGKLLGWRTVCAVEWEPYPASVLCARQNDGLLPPFPIWDDVQTFDGKPWRGIVDVVSGGFPCQDISAAGKGAGIDGERSGMWGEMARIIREVRPRFVFVENSPMLTSRGLGRVLGDLASMGFDAKWGVLGAGQVGAPHKRDRIWIVGNRQMAYSRRKYGETRLSKSREFKNNNSSIICERYSNEKIWNKEAELSSMRIFDGMASRVDRLKAIGNGQVPLCAATAWRILNGN
jgi:DNA (cytosine-5)-methyltransferase 1